MTQCPQKLGRQKSEPLRTKEQNYFIFNFSLFLSSLAIQGGEQHLLDLYLLVQHTDPSVLHARETPSSNVLVLWVRLGFEWQSPGLCFDCRGVKQYLNNCQPLEGAESQGKRENLWPCVADGFIVNVQPAKGASQAAGSCL